MNDHDPVTVVDRTGTVDRYYVALGQLLTTMEQATAETQKQIDNWKQYQLETSVVRVTPDGANELLAVVTAERDALLAERAKRDDALCGVTVWVVTFQDDDWTEIVAVATTLEAAKEAAEHPRCDWPKAVGLWMDEAGDRGIVAAAAAVGAVPSRKHAWRLTPFEVVERLGG